MKKVVIFTITMLLVSLASANLTSESEDHSDYESWKAKHGKNFEEDEDRYRMFIYRQRVSEIKMHNQNTKHSWKKAQNRFSAETDEELLGKYLGAVPPKLQDVKQDLSEDQEKAESVPHKVGSNPIVRESPKNWATEGVLGPVKNQGVCGSCWTFTAAAVIQAHLKITNNITVDLSEQQQVDCVYPGYNGCDGGWMTDSFYYAMTNGLTTEIQYPYKDVYGSCLKDQGAYKIKQYVEVKTQDCSSIVENVAVSGPLAVGVLVVADWYSYSSGIYSCPDYVTPDHSVNHGVVMVSYTEDNNFIIQNSWGTTWGQDGFMTLNKDKNCNSCLFGPYLITA